jgi:hypothetical protein
MNSLGIALLSAFALAMLFAPRRWAALALVLSALYVTRGQVLEIGPANFTVPRGLILSGFIRILLRGESVATGMHSVDRLVLLWAAVLIGTSAAHMSGAWLFRSGVVWTEVGCYFLFRIFLRNLDDVEWVFKAVSVAALPVAALMLMEKSSGENAFGAMGGVNTYALVRQGQFRAAGPFAHPILAGTVGAAILTMGLCLWRRARLHAWAGIGAGASIVYACASSGPVLMALSIVLGLLAWRARDHMRLVRGLAVTAIVGLAAIMNDPVYFVVARIDISGGSTGYFRAQLIRSSIEHLPEWWLAGTDHTRHWMPSGIYANDQSTDITSHILAMGVLGGIALLLVFLLILYLAFRDVGRAMQSREADPARERFLVWALGALLFGFLMTFLSILLFDQSVMFFWLTLAAIECSAASRVAADARSPASPSIDSDMPDRAGPVPPGGAGMRPGQPAWRLP